MGHNTVALILNDRLHEIKADKDYGAKLYYAACSYDRVDRWAGREAPGTTIIHEGHADVTAMILAGGNCGKVVGTVYNQGRFWAPEDTERAVKDILRGNGYQVGRRRDWSKQRVSRQEETSVIDAVADLTRPAQADVLAAHAVKLADENRLLLVEIEKLKARVAELGG